jgi:Tfp pilus assembly protein PilF/peroxiredoxin
MRWAPMLFIPAPLRASSLPGVFARHAESDPASRLLPYADSRFTPHYPSKSPLDELFRQVLPGNDDYIAEKYAFELTCIFAEWSRALRTASPALDVLAKILGDSLEFTPFAPAEETTLRSAYGIEIVRRKFASKTLLGREPFLREIKNYLAPMSRVETAEFEIVEIKEISGSSPFVEAKIRYDFVGTRTGKGREERIGHWLTRWSRDAPNSWRAIRWQATEETLSRSREPVFIDITSQALGKTDSYKNQLLHGVDHWRTVLDGACGIDVYGNNGLAAGDFDNDGFDDLYVCQPAGLPNRLYRNRGDGTFEDVTEKSGLGVLDGTSCALFADFQNKGVQDLLVVCGSGPLLFLNQGHGKFSLKRDAFHFAKPPQGTFTHAALADYDRDGLLDIYFCVYSYYLGLDQYHYPVPYFDARNGPPNFLFHNEGNANFQDRTEASGLNLDNDRYSFACAWGDSNSDGWPDLYVANDFGRSNLYRNNGDGKFTVVSAEAGVEDVGAGMSASWCDFDNDGNQDIYVSNMWSSAGLRISEQEPFHKNEPEEILGFYRRHARGNSFYRNQGNGKFKNVSSAAGAEMGRWAWSSDAWDFDHDGYSDLYIANGYISEPNVMERSNADLSSFFWRHVVANSPQDSNPAPNYEQGWSAINELIRSDFPWSGSERNVFHLNNHDGTFSEVSGAVGLDFLEDGRSFALADIDRDGRLEIILKNRNAPQLRILRNATKEIGQSIAFRLRGRKSNRDAIGAAVTVEADGHRQTKYLQAGTGFLSQHSKEIFFGLGMIKDAVRASIRWPNGLTQAFEHLPVGQRIEIEEGSENFLAKPFENSPASYAQPGEPPKPELLPSSAETWLIEPLAAPEFSLPDLLGNVRTLQSLRGSFALLHFWSTASPVGAQHLQLLQKHQSDFASNGFRLACINIDEPADAEKTKSFVAREKLSLPILLGTQEVAGIYNIVYRYLFDRRRDLGIPTSFLINESGLIVKLYQGSLRAECLLEDVKSSAPTQADRMRRALPFDGTLYSGGFQRNDFTYGVAMFQRGYLDQASASFQQVIVAKPDDPEAYYNLGTLELRRNALPAARRNLEQTVKLRPDYPEAWNNLGMTAAQEGKADEAIRNFQRSLQLKPGYTVALLNLGNFYRRQGAMADAEQLLSRAVESEPNNPEANYSLGMLYARQEQPDRAATYLERAVSLRSDYADALNNLGVVFVREKRFSEAKEKFEACIRVAPDFDQGYLNLARLYVILDEKAKAREALLALLQRQPGHKMAQQALEMLD